MESLNKGGPGLATAENFHLPHLSEHFKALGLVTVLPIIQAPEALPPGPHLRGGFLWALPCISTFLSPQCSPSWPWLEPGGASIKWGGGAGVQGAQGDLGPPDKLSAFASGLRVPPTGKDSQARP